MFKKKKISCGIMFLSFFIFPVLNYASVNRDFTPHWQVGDSWEIVGRSMSGFEPGYVYEGPTEFPDVPFYVSFKIIDLKELDEEMCYVLKITGGSIEKDNFLHLYIRQSDFTLKQIDKFTKDDSGRIRQKGFPEKNGHDFAMFYSLSYFDDFLGDFPNFPATNIDEERTIKMPSGLTTTQKIVFTEANTATVELVTKVGTRTIKTTQIWEKGKPWWSSLKRTLTYYDYAAGEEKTRVEYDPVLAGVDTTPPALSLSVNPAALWPPNHQMVEVIPAVTAADDYDRFPEVKLYAVESSEPDDAPGAGDGNTTQDIETSQVWDTKQHKMVDKILLRAERDGKGTGRLYTITYTATDFSGNVSKASAVVTVAHDAAAKKVP